ncbi:MAG: DUF2905 domain-containing protein [Nitrospira sp.]|nr:DUF2905 domain-containing protein [Nitrospira sp.]
MAEWANLGKVLLGAGALIALTGVLLLLSDRVPGLGSVLGLFGRLPGDISFKRDNFSLYIPLGTSLVLSILLSLVFYFLSWMLRR